MQMKSKHLNETEAKNQFIYGQKNNNKRNNIDSHLKSNVRQ